MAEGLYILDTDASNVGLGAVLSQLQNGEEKVICYYSKTFSKTERKYCVTRRELLAIISSIKQFHHYLYGQFFKVRTDHGALTWLINFKNPEGQLARWFEFLSTYQFKIEHRAGKAHGNADALSRRPCVEDLCNHCTRAEQKYDLSTNIISKESELMDSRKDTGEDTGEDTTCLRVYTRNQILKESSSGSSNPSSPETEVQPGTASQEFMMAYRSSVHESTGVSPCEMTFGHSINLPVDLVLGRLPTYRKSPDTNVAFARIQTSLNCIIVNVISQPCTPDLDIGVPVVDY